jgi:hypothetical protein
MEDRMRHAVSELDCNHDQYDRASPAPADADMSKYISLQQAAVIVPGNPHVSTISRWATEGLKVRNQRVFLRHVLVGKRIHTTREWLDGFFVNVQVARQAARLAKSDKLVLRDHRAATLRLQEMGA